MSDDRARIGIIGTGGIAVAHAKGITELSPSCDLVAACEPPAIEVVTAAADGPSVWEHFARCVRDEETPLTDGTSARKALELVMAIYTSMDTGSPVGFPIAGSSARVPGEV